MKAESPLARGGVLVLAGFKEAFEEGMVSINQCSSTFSLLWLALSRLSVPHRVRSRGDLGSLFENGRWLHGSYRGADLARTPTLAEHVVLYTARRFVCPHCRAL